MLDSFRQDLRYAARAAARQPGTTALAAISIALGIGATSAVFSLVNGLLLKSLPVAHAERLVRVGRSENREGFLPFSHQQYLQLRGASHSLDALIAHQPNEAVLGTGTASRTETMEIVSGNYFDALGVRLTLGRGFLAEEDDAPGLHPVVVLADRLWKGRFGSDPRVVGSTVRLNGHPFTVVGVAATGFSGTFPGFDVGFWVPTAMLAQALPTEPPLDEPGHRFLLLIGRRAPGNSRDVAQAELRALAARFAAEQPEAWRGSGIDLADAGGVHPFIAGLVKAFLALLMGIVGLVLLIACANVAGLLLARAVVRRREIAVRLTLGASRFRLIRQLLTESLVLSLLGVLGGALLAVWLSRAFAAFRPPVGIPIRLDVAADWRVFLFAVALGVGAAILFGLVPALQASRSDPATALKESGSSAGRTRSFLGNTLVAGQVAVSAVLLAGALLLVRSLVNARTGDPGFDAKGVLVVSPEPGLLGYSEPRARLLLDDLEARLRALPGVTGTALALMIPLGDRGDQLAVAPAEQAPPDGSRVPIYGYNYVGPGYFRTLGIGLAKGREFLAADAGEAPAVAVVNETMAGRFWPGREAIGRRIMVFDRSGRGRDAEIVGVARDAKVRFLGEGATPYLYLPFGQWYRADMRILVRGAPGVAGLPASVARTLRTADPDLPGTVTTLEDEMAFSLVPARVAAAVLGFAGATGVLLASVGLFGVVWHMVARRRREIGLRMALGATASGVRRLVVRHALKLVLVGLVPGLLLAFGATRLLGGLLYGVGPGDPLSFGSIALGFAAVALLASYVPARRAARVDPMVVLRDE